MCCRIQPDFRSSRLRSTTTCGLCCCKETLSLTWGNKTGENVRQRKQLLQQPRLQDEALEVWQVSCYEGFEVGDTLIYSGFGLKTKTLKFFFILLKQPHYLLQLGFLSLLFSFFLVGKINRIKTKLITEWNWRMSVKCCLDSYLFGGSQN